MIFILIWRQSRPHLYPGQPPALQPVPQPQTFLRSWTEAGNNTSLHLLVGQTIIYEFVPQVLRAILAKFQDKYLFCPTSPEEWKRVEENFRTTWNVLHAVGAPDGRHIAMTKTKKSGSDYYNYKGFFFLVLLALVDAE